MFKIIRPHPIYFKEIKKNSFYDELNKIKSVKNTGC